MSVYGEKEPHTREQLAEVKRLQTAPPDIPNDIIYVIPNYERFSFRPPSTLTFVNDYRHKIMNIEAINTFNDFINDVIYKEKNYYYYVRGDISTKVYTYMGKNITFDFSSIKQFTKEQKTVDRKDARSACIFDCIVSILSCGRKNI